MMMRSNRLSALVALTAGAAASACGPSAANGQDDVGSDETVSSVHEELFLESGATPWKGPGNKGNVPVPFCWDVPLSPDWDNFDSQKAVAVAQIKRTWQAVSGVVFNFQGAC